MTSSKGGDSDNGKGAVQEVYVDSLILTYTPSTDHMEIAGSFSSIDKALDMLERARRKLDQTWRLEQVRAMQQAAADAALRQQLAQQHKH